jgi:hypothetical protein
MSPEKSRRRLRSSHIILAAWLVLTSALAIVNHVALFRHKEDVDRRLSISVDSVQLSLYVEKLEQLQEQVTTLASAPAGLSESHFVIERQALLDQIEAIKRTLSDFAPTSELKAIRDQLRTVGRLQKVRRAETTPPPGAKASAEPDELHPPFTVIAVEGRGGERFLSVLPLGSRSVVDVQLVRVGEALGSWQLSSIEAETALFQVGERHHRVALP